MRQPGRFRGLVRWILTLCALLGALAQGGCTSYVVERSPAPRTATAEAIARPENARAAADPPAAVEPPAAPDPPEPAIARQRPYKATSFWNTPIGADPEYDPYSSRMVETIGFSNGGQITSDTTQYTYPVYFVDGSTPRWDLPCIVYACTVLTEHGVERTPALRDVPIPADARPSRGTDAQMIIIDMETGAEYDLWQVKRTGDGWTISNGSRYNIHWDGTPAEYGSRGAGVPYYAGLIRPWEIREGRIEHAIAFGYPNPARDRCVFPASKTDGKSDVPYAIPEGARLQLDPALTEADFDRMGLDRTGKIIARALQQYGMVLIDYAGRPKIYAEDLTNNPYAARDWADPELGLAETTIANIPYTAFRVLALPPAYWAPALESPMHGECYAY